MNTNNDITPCTTTWSVYTQAPINTDNDQNSLSTNNDFPLPLDIFRLISHHLDTKTFLRWTLVSKSVYKMSQNPCFKCYAWILRSHWIQQKEEKSDAPLISYPTGSTPDIFNENYPKVLQKYGNVNYLKKLIEEINKQPNERDKSKIIELLHLAYDQLQDDELFDLLLETYKNNAFGLNPEEWLKLAKIYATSSPHVMQCLLKTYEKGVFGLDPKEGLELAKTYADQGNEMAIICLCLTFKKPTADAFTFIKTYADKGSEGAIKRLINNLPFPYEERLELAKTYANKGSNYAVSWLLETYKTFTEQEIVSSEELLNFLKIHADQGNEQAIKYLLNSYSMYGRLEKEGLRLTQYYAKQGSEYAGMMLLTVCNDDGNVDNFKRNPITRYSEGLKYATTCIINQGSKRAVSYFFDAHLSGGFGLKRDDETKIKGIQFLKEHADKGLESAIELLLNYSEGLQLANTYAKRGSETGVNFLLTAYNWGHCGLQSNHETKREGLRLAKIYAEKGSQKGIDYLGNAYANGYFSIDTTNPETQNEGLRLATTYAYCSGSDTFKRFVYKYLENFIRSFKGESAG